MSKIIAANSIVYTKPIYNTKKSNYKMLLYSILDTIVVHQSIAKQFIPEIVKHLQNVHIRVLGDTVTRQFASVDHAPKADWSREFLGPAFTI